MSFWQSAKALVSQRTNIHQCWNCEAPRTEYCHVVADGDLAPMASAGILPFSALGDYRNAVLLCGGCRNHFDPTSETGWLFLPIDLEWFIQWEEKDFAKRQQVLEDTGRKPERTYPNEQDYEDHMRESGRLSDPDDGLCRGGLYNRYILRAMFAPYMMEALERRGMTTPRIFPGGPKRWRGAPMPAKNRGFVAMGTPLVQLPSKEWDTLFSLQKLYARPLSTSTDREMASGASESQWRPPRAESYHVNSAHRKMWIDQDSMADEELGVSKDSWCFGPNSTTSDKIFMHVGKRV